MPRKSTPLVLKICPTCYGAFMCKSYRNRTYCSKHCAANFPAVQEKNRIAVAELFKMKYGKHPMKLKTTKRIGPPKASPPNKFAEEVTEFVKTLVPISTNQKVLAPLEVDIFVPSKRIAIEAVNIQEHSEIKGGKHKNYHLNKTKMASMRGVRLIHVFQDDWMEKKVIVKSVLKNLLVKENRKVYARQCKVIEVDTKLKNKFLNENHLRGTDRTGLNFGLICDGEIVAVLTVKTPRYRRHADWEISRVCSKCGVTVVGGISKLFSYFVKHHTPGLVSAYTDRRYFSGEIFLKLEFNFVKNNPPTSHYAVDSYETVESANNWRKDRLAKKLKKFDKSLSEWENMKINGFDRIWDCGHSKWVWKSQKTT